MSGSIRSKTYPGATHDAVWRSLVFPPDYENPRADRRYHLIVIGAGPAGLVCAMGAASLGARVALVERKAMGGDCLNVGCVPSKALLEYVRHHPRGASFDAAFAWMREVRARLAVNDSVRRFTEHGIDVYLGEAQFVDDVTVQVHEQQLAGRRIVVATGARTAFPNVPGLIDVDPLTSESIFDLERAPESLAIVGAGPIGCELAQALAPMGISVYLLERAPRVLPQEEPEASAAVLDGLLREGVEAHLGVEIDRVEKLGKEIRVALDGGELRVRRLLLATGRRANVEALSLDVAGVELTDDGLIKVDRHLRTSNPRIFAAGDVCSNVQFTHAADAQARIVVQNALFAPTARSDRLVVPSCTYTSPEVARVGSTRAALERANVDFDRYAVALGDLDRGQLAGDEAGFAELLVNPRNGRILGATVVAENAAELITPVCVAMSRGLGLGALGRTVFPYPTRSEFLRRLCDDYNRTRWTPMISRLVGIWLRLRR